MRHGSYRQSPGIFYTIAWYVEEVQFVLIDLIGLLDSHWAVRWAKPYAEDARDYLADVIANLWKADTWATDIAEDVSDAIESGDLNGLIEQYAPGVADFFDDPWKEIKAILRKERPKGYALFDDPFGEIDNWLKDKQPKLWAFKEDPKQYVLDRLKDIDSDLYDFALDPLGWIATQVGDLQADVTKFLDDPSGVVYDHLVKIDSPLAPFWDDPGEWVIDRILDWTVEAILRDWRS